MSGWLRLKFRLLDVGDGEIFLTYCLPTIGGEFAGDDLQECGFSRPVGPHHSNPLSGVDDPVDRLEQNPLAEALVDFFQTQKHEASLIQKAEGRKEGRRQEAGSRR